MFSLTDISAHKLINSSEKKKSVHHFSLYSTMLNCKNQPFVRSLNAPPNIPTAHFTGVVKLNLTLYNLFFG